MASQEEANSGPGFVVLLSLTLVIALLYWVGFKLLHLIDAHTVSLMRDTDDEETDSEAAADDDGDDAPDGDVDKDEDEEVTVFTKQPPNCLCDSPDPQIPCVTFKGSHQGDDDNIDHELGIPTFKVVLLKEFLMDPARELTGPLGINLLPFIPLEGIEKVNTLLRVFALDHFIRHLSKTCVPLTSQSR